MIAMPNIHPIIVHFPIALLTVYCAMECLRFKHLLASWDWFWVKASFLFLGGLGALAALYTGGFGRSLFPDEGAIIRAHENFAHWVVIIFGLIALIYLARAIDILAGAWLRGSELGSLWRGIVAIDNVLFRGWVLVPAAIIGFIVLFITGALGGSIVFGPTNDPFTRIVNQLFVR